MSLIQFNLLKQMRTYKFMFVVMVSILLGILCVPGLSDGYEIFYMGGVRGIYNSAWLGALAAMSTSIILWLPGFYMQRSQITEDQKLKIGQIIASTPMSKLQYIFGKFISNLVVLLVLDGLFLISMVAMQFIRHESMSIDIWQYIGPQAILVIPSLVFCASLSVLLDVFPGMKGAIGNCVMFFLWTFLIVVSIEMPSSVFDVFGLGFVLDEMSRGARVFYPNVSDGGSFGYHKIEGSLSTFQWDGLNWSSEIIASRAIIVLISLGLVVLTALIFNRFRETSKSKHHIIPEKDRNNPVSLNTSRSIRLTPIVMSRNVNFIGLVKGELKLLLYGQPLWWYALALIGIGISGYTASGEGAKWTSIIMLLPMALWSQMGSRDTLYGTEQLLNYSCSRSDRWLAAWLAGIIVSLLMSSGILIRFAVTSLWSNLIAWSVGMVFIPTMAMTFGSISKSPRLFEAVFIVIFYIGPIQEMGRFDFLGITHNNASLYIVLTAVLFAVGYFYQELKEKWVIK